MASALISSILKATTDWLSLIGSTPTTSSASTTVVADDLERLKRMLERIEAVLQDAEEREIVDKSVKLWLKEIRDVAFDAEDLVDEYQYHVLQAQVENRAIAAACRINSRKRKYVDGEDEVMMPLISSASNIASSNISILSSMADRIKNIRKRFKEISNDRDRLQLKSQDGHRRRDSSCEYPQPTSHMVNEQEIYGREDDRKKLMDWLFSAVESKFEVLAVIGKGGLGKTTLAQLIYNDQNVSCYFEQRMWICVSEDFDVVRLTRAMLESVTKEPCFLSEQLSLLQESLQKILHGKRVLLVLDDVWNENKALWESLSVPFHYTEMIRIIVTTRNDSVAEIMQTTDPHRLGYLTEEQSWLLFLRHAFCDRDPELFLSLLDIGKKIVKKCDGLPLAVKSLGGLLQHELEEDRWKDVLESEVWQLDGETDILPALRLSYIRMPSHLKPCFAICYMFPKDHEFEKDELVKLWAAHGYIQCKVEKNVKEMGCKYFNELHKRSFFDDYCTDLYKMHDNIHDLACYVQLSSDGKQKVRHLFTKPESLEFHLDDVGALRTLMVADERNTIAMNDMLQRNITHLRYLNICLQIYPSREEILLPEGIGNLICLRHLKLDVRAEMKLPISIGSLYNLAMLEIYCHGLDELPETFGNLVCLQHLKLDIMGKTKLPKSIGDLHNLAVMEIHSRGLVDLPESLRTLVSLTTIDFYYFEIDQLPALGQLPSLRSLTLGWLVNVQSIGNEFYRGLDACHHVAFPSLTSLVFDSVLKWKKWDEFQKGDFPQLQKLEIKECSNLSSLPSSLRNLSLLSYIRLQGCRSLRLSSEGPFPLNLKTLMNSCFYKLCVPQGFGELKKLERLQGIFSVRIEEVFGILRKFGNLKCVALSRLCNVHSAFFKGHACLREYKGFERLVLNWSLHKECMDEEVLHLVVERDDNNCGHHSDGKNASFSVLDNLQPHFNLKELEIVDYDGDLYPSWIGDPSFNKLTSIKLKGSKVGRLPALGQLPCLKNLHLSSMSRLKRIGHEFCRGINQSLYVVMFPSLSNLELEDMHDWEEWYVLQQDYFPQLQCLSIRRCPKLLSLPDLRNFGLLLDLRILECPLIQLSSNVSFPPNLKTLEYKKSGSRICLSPGGNLPKLKRFNGEFGVGKDGFFKILKNIPENTQCLTISGLRNICIILEEAEADLKSRHELELLTLGWSNFIDSIDSDEDGLQLVVEDDDFKFPRNEKEDDDDESKKTCFFVLEKLQPHVNLYGLTIVGYSGVGYPSWIGHPSFDKLSNICLCSCIVDQLPTLGQLPSLTYLDLDSISGLKRIDDEFCRGINDRHNLVAFPSLAFLRFNKMHALLEWNGMQLGDFPKLYSLKIIGCPKLSSLPDVRNLGTDLSLSIYACPAIHISVEYESCEPRICLSVGTKVLKFEKLTGTFGIRNEALFGFLKKLPLNTYSGLTIAALRNVPSVMEAEASLKCQHGLESLTLQWSASHCSDFLCLVVDDGDDFVEDDNGINKTDQASSIVLEKLQPHTNLQQLEIEGYDGVGYPSWIGHPSFDKLTAILLRGLKTDQLPTLGQLPSLESLSVRSTSCLKRIGNEFCRGMTMNNERVDEDKVAFPSLEYLAFRDMNAWEEWYGVLDGDFPQLSTLLIEGCPNLRRDLVSFPRRLLEFIDETK